MPAPKHFIAAIAGAVLLVAPLAAAADDFTGTWHVSGTIQAPGSLFSATPTCVFQQAGSQLTGTCKGPHSLGPVTGQVHGESVDFEWLPSSYTPDGASGAVEFAGTRGGDNVIRGAVRYSGLPGLVGAFTAQQ